MRNRSLRGELLGVGANASCTDVEKGFVYTGGGELIVRESTTEF